MHALFLHFRYELREIRESFAIQREVLVALHVIDIQVDAVKRDAGAAIPVSHLPDLILVHIAPAALSQAEGPLRRNVASPDDRAESGDDLPGGLPLEDIDVRVVLLEVYPHLAVIRIAKVKLQLARGVDVEAEAPVLPAVSLVKQQEILRSVERPARLQMVGHIAVP